jgi:hypothetical protein
MIDHRWVEYDPANRNHYLVKYPIDENQWEPTKWFRVLKGTNFDVLKGCNGPE